MNKVIRNRNERLLTLLMNESIFNPSFFHLLISSFSWTTELVRPFDYPRDYPSLLWAKNQTKISFPVTESREATEPYPFPLPLFPFPDWTLNKMLHSRIFSPVLDWTYSMGLSLFLGVNRLDGWEAPYSFSFSYLYFRSLFNPVPDLSYSFYIGLFSFLNCTKERRRKMNSPEPLIRKNSQSRLKQEWEFSPLSYLFLNSKERR